MSDRRAWADLPLEIISPIRERLLWEDYFNFRFTCRNWNFAAEFDGTVYENAKYPFLLRFSKSNEKKNSSSSSASPSSGIYCRAYSPAYNKTYYLHAPAELSGARISCSGYGWLLFSGQHRIFFYFPSTGQAINLPYYTQLGRGSFNQMSFSAPPTSPDCVVLGLIDTECTTGAEIVFLRRGQTDWQLVRAKNTIRLRNHRTKKLITSKKKKTIRVKSNAVCLQKFPGAVKVEFPRPRYNCSPLFHKGAFYCLDRDGRLGVINPKGKKKKKDETWRILDTSAPRHFMDDPRNEAYLVECKGELIAVVVGPMGKMVRILRFYKRARVWQMVHSLGNQMVFLSHVGSVAVECRDGQAREWENTIHFPRFRGNRHVFYSISSGQFHSFDDDGEHTWDDLYETSHPLSHAWLTPVFCIPLGARLDWSKKGRTKKHHHHHTSRRMHPHYVIRNLSFLLPPSEHPYQQNKQPEAPIAQPCLVLSNEYDDEEVAVVNLAQEEGKMVVRNSRSSMMAEAELALRIGGRKVYSNPEHGLLVLMDDEAHTCSVLDLKSMVETQLPPLETSGNCRDVVVHVPSGDSKLAVIAFGEEDEGVEHRDVAMAWRDGDEEWTRHAKQGTDPHNGTVFHQGKMYGYRGWWAFVTIELRRDGEYLVEERTEVEDPEFRSTPGFERFTAVLVGSCGELLLFVKYYASNCHYTQVESVVLGISVFKMDFDDMEWRMLEDLGDRAFFWGGWGCYSCCASKSGFERNAIYFVEEYGRDVQMYDYVDHSIVVTLPRPDLDDSWMIDGFFMLYE
ncbi:unnamed protein product [Linum trigynum]|uniref:KIB1-4 beta-propeller domain-containing protein n=1 Tax=Linum trigynum TaxID=586398 RepID=A0AAV2GW14_9ROSI